MDKNYSIKIEFTNNEWIFNAFHNNVKINNKSYSVTEEQRISNKMEAIDICQEMMKIVKNDIDKNINKKAFIISGVNND